MRRGLEDEWASEADLESTSKLPVLDVAAYEAQQAARRLRPALRPAADWRPSPRHALRGAARTPPPPVEGSSRMLVWTSLAKVEGGDHEPPASAPPLREDPPGHPIVAATADGAPAPLTHEPGRGAGEPRAGSPTGSSVPEADGPAPAPTPEVDPTRGPFASSSPWQIAPRTDLDGTRQWLVGVMQARASQERERAAVNRALAERADQVARLEAELAAVRAHIEVTERARERDESHSRTDLALLTRSVLGALGRIVHLR